MSEENIVTYTREELEKLGPGKTDYEKLKNLTDEEIAVAVANDPDAAPIDLDWSKAELWVPANKTALSIRLDSDVLEFFRKGGRGYQTRINAVLRTYMDHKTDKKQA